MDQLTGLIDQIFGAHAATALAIIKIIGINIVLSGDNAVVIALACRNLPPSQRRAGILLGAGAAVILRVIFTVLIAYILGVPWLKLIGGLLLFWIAIKLVKGEEAGEESVKAGNSLFEAVKIVAIADIVMSLDNVLAIAAAAKDDMTLIIVGLLISIPLVVFGATLILSLLTRFPILVWGGAALLGWVAGELIATEPGLKMFNDQLATYFGVGDKTIAKSFEVLGAGIVILGGLLLSRGKAQHSHAA